MKMELIKFKAEEILRECNLEVPDNPDIALANAIKILIDEMNIPKIAATAFITKADTVNFEK